MRALYQIIGKVEVGNERGRKLGFPTANIKLDENIPEGIYISEIQIDNQIYKASTFVGVVRTFGENEYLLESYILDFDENIYGKEITVRLLKKIRENEKFESEELLVRKMQEDIQITKIFFLSRSM